MKRLRFTEEKIIGVLREAEDGAKTADLARKHDVSTKPCIRCDTGLEIWRSNRPEHIWTAWPSPGQPQYPWY